MNDKQTPKKARKTLTSEDNHENVESQKIMDQQAFDPEKIKEQIMQELIATAFYDAGELFDEHGNLKPLADVPEHARLAIDDLKIRLKLSGQYNENGRPILIKNIAIKYKDKLRALKKFGKHLGCFD